MFVQNWTQFVERSNAWFLNDVTGKRLLMGVPFITLDFLYSDCLKAREFVNWKIIRNLQELHEDLIKLQKILKEAPSQKYTWAISCNKKSAY